MGLYPSRAFNIPSTEIPRVTHGRGDFAKLGEVGLRGRDEIANQLSLAASSDLLYAIVLK